MESQIIRPGYLTAHQVARILGVGLPTVRKMVGRGQLARTGGSVGQPWYAVEDVTALALKRRTRKAA
jgi:predicted site-specific integrase-resolvase